jgi:hypothetical protein
VKRGRPPPFIKLASPADRLIGAQTLHRGPAPLELRDHVGVGMQPPIGADPEDQTLRKHVEDVFEILQRERMPFPAPPAQSRPGQEAQSNHESARTHGPFTRPKL